MTPSSTKRESTFGAAIGFLLLAVAVVGLIASIFLFPQVFENVLWAIIIVVGALILIGAGIALISFLLIIPMYAKKGVEYQTNVSYDLDDVKDVSGKMEGKKE